MRPKTAVAASLLWIALLLPAGGNVCLPSPESIICPTCPSLLRCYGWDDWLDYFLPGFNGLG